MGKRQTGKRTLKLRTKGRRALRSLDAGELEIVSGGTSNGRKFTRACGGDSGSTTPTDPTDPIYVSDPFDDLG